MTKQALALCVLACLLCALHPAELNQSSGKQVKVGKGGLKLYPRFNKSLKPIAELKEGQTLTVEKEFRNWKYVKVNGKTLKGWVYIKKIKKSIKVSGKKMGVAAAPSTAGLVAKGFSKEYASRHGADFSKVAKLKARKLDTARFESFLKGEVKK